MWGGLSYVFCVACMLARTAMSCRSRGSMALLAPCAPSTAGWVCLPGDRPAWTLLSRLHVPTSSCNAAGPTTERVALLACMCCCLPSATSSCAGLVRCPWTAWRLALSSPAALVLWELQRTSLRPCGAGLCWLQMYALCCRCSIKHCALEGEGACTLQFTLSC